MPTPLASPAIAIKRADNVQRDVMDKESFHREINKNCEPLFFLDEFLNTGHSQGTANATVTYIKFESKFYALTCRHVIEGLLEENSRNRTRLGLATSYSRSFSFFHRLDPGSGRFIPSFVIPQTVAAPDIAIHLFGSALPGPQSSKGKQAIDLDQFVEPLWANVTFGAAVGFGTEHKYPEVDKVAAPMHVVVADLANNVRDDSTQIILSSALDKPHNTFFSGMSGGPLYVEDGSDMPKFAGIVFEGIPGGSKAWKERKPEEAFMKESDILIYALRVTPEVLRNWLQACVWP